MNEYSCRTTSQRLKNALAHGQQRPVVLSQNGCWGKQQRRTRLHGRQRHRDRLLQLCVLPDQRLRLQGCLGLGGCLLKAVGLGSDVGQGVLCGDEWMCV